MRCAIVIFAHRVSLDPMDILIVFMCSVPDTFTKRGDKKIDSRFLADLGVPQTAGGSTTGEISPSYRATPSATLLALKSLGGTNGQF